MNTRYNTFLILSLMIALGLLLVSSANAQPGYEPAYVNGQTVTINAIEVPQNAPPQAQADFYQVVYPVNWQALNVPAPQCNPCDHDGNGIDYIDFHDHILDSMPSNPGHGNFHPLWHVNLVIPFDSLAGGNPANDDAVRAAYAAQLPTRSEAAVDALLATTLPDGTPIAIEIDTHFYFLCAVVNQNAVH